MTVKLINYDMQLQYYRERLKDYADVIKIKANDLDKYRENINLIGDDFYKRSIEQLLNLQDNK